MTLLAASKPAWLQRAREAVVFLIALVLSIAVHEFGHALVADKLGDRTPRLQGRVTLNPLVHADPIGTFLLPLMLVLFSPGFFFGWGKPVQVNPAAFTRKLRMKVAHMFVALAGPAMNVVLGLLVTLVLAILVSTNVVDPTQCAFGARAPSCELLGGIRMVIALNFVLVFFNLIPCPPLDGGAVLAGILPDKHQNIVEFLSQYGFIIIIALIMTPVVNIFLYPAMYISQTLIRLAGA